METPSRRTRPQKEQALNCPRCNSTNTKFCYYNNYSLTQPRYFCKACRRYWTEGGSLRNVPVGGGSRKNKRSISSSSTSSPSSSSPALPKKLVEVGFPNSAPQNPKIHQGQDLNLAYHVAEDHNFNQTHHQNSSSAAMDLLKTGNGISSRGLMSSFMQMPLSVDSNAVFSTGFPSQEFKPSLNFSLEGFENGYGNLQENGAARLLFPVEEEWNKQVPSTTDPMEQNRQGDQSGGGYWSGMLGGGSW